MEKASGAAMRNRWLSLRWYALALLVVMLDQYTKILAESALDYGRPLEVFSWFNLTLQYNTGAAFSLLSDAGGWQEAGLRQAGIGWFSDMWWILSRCIMRGATFPHSILQTPPSAWGQR